MNAFVVRFLFLLILCFWHFNLFAQQGTYAITQPIPPSPDAAKIAQFEFAPTSLYTGTHSFSIPIHDIQLDQTSIPITLSYHSGGIRASENASWVGLGWSLSFGGSLSRTVRGYDDLNSGGNANPVGYCYDTNSIPEALGSTLLEFYNHPYWLYLKNGLHDTEPDMFSYNFAGASGKFVLSKASETNNVIEVIKLDENADKITFNPVDNSFTVITSNGTKGIFSVKEYTTNISGSNDLNDWTACDYQYVDVYVAMNYNSARAATTWYPKTVITNAGNTLNFAYDVNSNGYSNYISISSKSWGEQGSVNSATNAAQNANFINTQSCSRLITEHIYPISITSTDTGIDINFAKSDRDDIEKLDPSNITYNSWLDNFRGIRNETITSVLKPQKLDLIRIKNTLPQSTLDVTCKLNNSYFGDATVANPDFLRLKLNSFERGAISSGVLFSSDQKYQFEYFDGLPNKSTKGFDYWGFYNGKDGNTQIMPVFIDHPPSAILWNWYAPQNYYYQTENRAANFTYGKAGLLNKVIYPTGGYTVFEYEAHDYRLEGKEHIPLTGYTSFSVSGLSADQTVSFGYKGYAVDGCSGAVTLQLSTKCKDFYLGNNCIIAPGDVNTVAVELTGPVNKQLRYDFQSGLSQNNYTSTTVYNGAGYQNPIDFFPGTYTLKGYGVRDAGNTKYYGDATITIPTKCLVNSTFTVLDVKRDQQTGGGRVKSIALFDQSDKLLQKKSFSYSTSLLGQSISSGRLMTPLMNMSYSYHPAGDLYWVFTSGSAIALGNAAQESHVAYSEVKEFIELPNGLDNGSIVHTYSNESLTIDAWSFNNQIALGNNMNGRINGYEKSNTAFRQSDYFPLTTKTLTNTNVNSGSINALKINMQYGPSGPNPSVHSFYKIYPGRAAVTEILTNDNGLITKEKMNYNSKNQLIQKIVEDANGNVLSTEINKYPIDYGPTASPVIQSMIDRNFIAPVIESSKQQRYDALLRQVDSEAIKFRLDGTRVVVDKMYKLNTSVGSFNFSSDGSSFSTALEEVTSVNKYDSKSNVLEFVGKDGITVSYIWGYNQNYPVAKLVGVTRTQIEALLGANYHTGTGGLTSTAINQLKTSFPTAPISTFTFNPGVGVSTMTDPNGKTTTYLYDRQGRLITIQDHAGKIVKTFEYNYYQTYYNGQ